MHAIPPPLDKLTPTAKRLIEAFLQDVINGTTWPREGAGDAAVAALLAARDVLTSQLRGNLCGCIPLACPDSRKGAVRDVLYGLAAYGYIPTEQVITLTHAFAGVSPSLDRFRSSFGAYAPSAAASVSAPSSTQTFTQRICPTCNNPATGRRDGFAVCTTSTCSLNNWPVVPL